MKMFDEPIKVSEDEYIEYWYDWQCESMERMCADHDPSGLSLGPCRTYLTVDKETGYREYVIFDPDWKPIIAARGLEEADMKLCVHRVLLRDKLDLRTIAETREVPKVV